MVVEAIQGTIDDQQQQNHGLGRLRMIHPCWPLESLSSFVTSPHCKTTHLALENLSFSQKSSWIALNFLTHRQSLWAATSKGATSI